MGLWNGIAPIGRVITHAAEAVVRMTGTAFRSRLLQIATTALGFIPGLNVAGWIGRVWKVLGTALRIQAFLRTGHRVFGELVRRFQLGPPDRFSTAAPLPLLGPGRSTGGSICEWIHQVPETGLQRFRTLLQRVRDGIQAFREMVAFLDAVLPGNWKRLTRGLREVEGAVDRWVREVGDLRQRLHRIHTMLCEVLRWGESPSSPAVVR